MTQEKHTNPKDAIGSGKIPMHLWPNTASAMGAIGLLNGMLKYGRTNWRASGVRASIYYDAARRHLDAWFEGEEVDPDDGVPHLAAALACLAILVDAGAADQLTDDRQIRGGYRGLMDGLTPHVSRLKELHEGKDPKHYTIEDRPKPAQGEDFLGGPEGGHKDLGTKYLEGIIDAGLIKNQNVDTILPTGEQPYRYPRGWDVMSNHQDGRESETPGCDVWGNCR